MVFLIQNTQNRDARAMHLKLDEIIRAMKGARNSLVDLEDLSDAEIASFSQEFQELHNHNSTLNGNDVAIKISKNGRISPTKNR